jgi:hypothetical protein
MESSEYCNFSETVDYNDKKEIEDVAARRTVGQCDSQLLRHGKDDGEPDLIYSLDSRTVGIEVTTAYYDDGQAKAEWKLARVQVDGAKFSLDNADKLIASRVRQAP